MNNKVCTKCKQEFPATSEWFTKDKSNKTGLGARCLACTRMLSNKYHAEHPELSKAWRLKNQSIIKQKKHLDYLKNIDKHKERCSRYFQEHREQFRLANALWIKNNPEKVIQMSHMFYERHKEKHKALTRKWKQNHKTERNVAWQLRRSKKLSLPHTLTTQQWELIKTAFDNKCCYCGKQVEVTQDHFVPVSQNGEYTHNNIVPACLSCNTSKNNKSFFDWYPTYRHYSKKREKAVLEFLCYDPNGYQQLKFAETL